MSSDTPQIRVEAGALPPSQLKGPERASEFSLDVEEMSIGGAI
ncbi:MAG: hypothetical protein QOK11_920, partial [Pseudonocardiales bacterium]|nr:hypothetical protein [Pseudonocardiales bacterium]